MSKLVEMAQHWKEPQCQLVQDGAVWAQKAYQQSEDWDPYAGDNTAFLHDEACGARASVSYVHKASHTQGPLLVIAVQGPSSTDQVDVHMAPLQDVRLPGAKVHAAFLRQADALWNGGCNHLTEAYLEAAKTSYAPHTPKVH